MFFLPPHLRQLFRKKKRGSRRAFSAEIAGLELTIQKKQQETGQIQAFELTQSQEFEIFPADPSIRKPWFSLTIREREVAALICMGYRNYEVAAYLGIGYTTVQSHLQGIFHKFNLRSRKEIRAALLSWPAEEWWNYHH